ncbi:MAG: M1 family metallopeptidase [Chlorobi bacterium]|nr:M1 family metallopeptidase [Chlorobiota bacterium]
MPHILFPAVLSFFLATFPLHTKPAYERPQAPQLSFFKFDSIDILHYTINLDIPDILSGMIYGVTDVQLNPLADSIKSVTLEFQGLYTDSVWIDEERVRSFSAHDKYLDIHLSEALIKGTTSILTVFYHGKPLKDPHWGGVYFVKGTAYVMGVCLSMIPHSAGRLWYPCIDDFREKSSYDYFITVADSLIVACPGVLKEIIPAKQKEKTYHWQMEQPISTYLSSFAISNYAVLKDTLAGLTHDIPASYFVPGKDSSKAVKTFSHVPVYLRTFESLFGPYQWEKIGYAGVPFPHGAMEHATCIFIPDAAIDGTLHAEDLLVHEFAHSWFGNLVTCATDSDMWLNEGFASYAVALYHEAINGKSAYKDYIRHLHRKTLQFTHIEDNGYYSVAGIPYSLTYGSTVYDKGADMIHNLRYYLGDRLFFESMQLYLKQFAFGNASTSDLESFLAEKTHKPMGDFFNTWIYLPGFPHYAISGVSIDSVYGGFISHIRIKQRLIGRNDFSYHTPLEISLMDSLWDTENNEIILSGEEETFSIFTPFKPGLILLDKNEKVNDGTTKEYKILHKPGNYAFDDCLFNLEVKQISDSVFFRVVHHWIGADTTNVPDGFTVSPDRYWSIEGIFPGDFYATGSFEYNFTHSFRNGWLDTSLPYSDNKKLVLLYRSSPESPWKEIPDTLSGNYQEGHIDVSPVLPGDYCLSVK